jgi:hypothetical protein
MAASSGFVPDFTELLALRPLPTAEQWQELLAVPATADHLVAVATALGRAGVAVEALVGPDALLAVFLRVLPSVATVASLKQLVTVVCSGRLPMVPAALVSVAAALVQDKPESEPKPTELFKWFLERPETTHHLKTLLPVLTRIVMGLPTEEWLLCLWRTSIACKLLKDLGHALGLAQRHQCVHASMRALVNKLLGRLVPLHGSCGLGGDYCARGAPFVFPDTPCAVLPFGHTVFRDEEVAIEIDTLL